MTALFLFVRDANAVLEIDLDLGAATIQEHVVYADFQTNWPYE